MTNIIITALLALALPAMAPANAELSNNARAEVSAEAPAKKSPAKKTQSGGRAIYDKYSDMRGVDAVFISSSMFKMIGRLPDFDAGDADDIDLGPVVKHLKGMYILDIEDNRSAAKELAKDVQSLIEKNGYELMMEAKEDGEITRMYTIGDEKTVYSLVILTVEDDETTFICIDGVIPRESLENAIAEAARD